MRALSLASESESALRQAVDLVPGHLVALKGLAVSHESARQDEAAIGYLEDLLALTPQDAEVCLRLGRIQARDRQPAAAEATLKGCIGKASPSWAVVVAYEELSLLLGRSGRWQEAVELLEQGSHRLPEEPRLRLLLSYALDRTQRPALARSVLAGLDPAGGSSLLTPRGRYGRWPQELFQKERRRLEPEVERRRQLLAAVLAEGTP